MASEVPPSETHLPPFGPWSQALCQSIEILRTNHYFVLGRLTALALTSYGTGADLGKMSCKCGMSLANKKEEGNEKRKQGLDVETCGGVHKRKGSSSLSFDLRWV